MVHHLVPWAVELRSQLSFRQRQAHGGGDTLAQGPRGYLHPRGMAVLGVARGLGAPLAEALDLVQGEVIARKVQDRIEEHGAMARR